MRGEGEPTSSSTGIALADAAGTRTVVRAAAWMLAQQQDLGSAMWHELWRIGTQAKSLRTRRMALQMFADRVDPLPRAVESDGRPQVLNVAIVLGEQAGPGDAALPAGRLSLHLNGGNGSSE